MKTLLFSITMVLLLTAFPKVSLSSGGVVVRGSLQKYSHFDSIDFTITEVTLFSNETGTYTLDADNSSRTIDGTLNTHSFAD